MDSKNFCLSIGAEGTILGYSTHLAVSYQHGELCYQGKVFIRNANVAELVALVSEEVAKDVTGYLPESMTKISADIAISHVYDHSLVSCQTETIYMVAIKQGGGSGFLLSLHKEENPEGFLGMVIAEAQSLLGIEEMFLLLREGNGISINRLLEPYGRDQKNVLPPTILKQYNAFLYSKFILDKDSVLGKAFTELLGVEELYFYAGMNRESKEYAFILDVPKIESQSVSVEELYLAVEKQTAGIMFQVRGDIRFSVMKTLMFRVECAFSPTSFLLQASAITNTPIELFDAFSIGSCTLLIGYQNGLTFGIIGELFVRQLNVFAAIIMRQEVVMRPSLLCFSISRLSLPYLISNLTGMVIPDASYLEFIVVTELPFSYSLKFKTKWFQELDYVSIVNYFNEYVETQLELDAEQIKVGKIDKGYALVDQKRMRHYFVDQEGQTFLRPQFYYSDISGISFGEYEISAGLFLCATIKIFGVDIKVLFSFQEEEGVLAFAMIEAIDLIFLRLTESKYSIENPIPLPKNSILYQFLDKRDKGVVFYLNASKTETSFYLDGAISLMGLADLETRIYYQKGMVQINAELTIFGLAAKLAVCANYTSFQNAEFCFYFEINTYQLEESLNRVRERLERAIQICREKINNATQSLRDAQTKVDRLYAEVSYLDGKICECKNKISSASWWKKAFVAVAMGVEIAALEVAKAGIYASIYIAKAALEVAIAAVNFAGRLSEGVLKLVNGVITAATSLFFIRYIRFSISANMDNQSVDMGIGFVALGKEYEFSKQIGKAALSQDGIGTISNSMNENMEDDLKDLENGVVSSLYHKKYALQHTDYYGQNLSLKDGIQELRQATGLLEEVQRLYVTEFDSSLPEFEETTVNYLDKLSMVEANLDVSKRSTNLEEWKDTVDELEGILTCDANNFTAQEKLGENQAREAIVHYRNAVELAKETEEMLQFLQGTKRQVRNSFQDNLRYSQKRQTLRGRNAQKSNASMGRFLAQTKEAVRAYFPEDMENGYINLSKDEAIMKSIEDAEGYFK